MYYSVVDPLPRTLIHEVIAIETCGVQTPSHSQRHGRRSRLAFQHLPGRSEHPQRHECNAHCGTCAIRPTLRGWGQQTTSRPG
eukprot:7336404-Alexandrium_andersonii.AAC.1